MRERTVRQNGVIAQRHDGQVVSDAERMKCRDDQILSTGARSPDFTSRSHGVPPPPPSQGQPGRRSTLFSRNLEYSGVPLWPGWPGGGGGGGGGGIPQQRDVKSAFWAPLKISGHISKLKKARGVKNTP